MDRTINHLNGLTLAYVGDAVYELYIRQYLIRRGIVKPNDLHQAAIKFVAGKAQAKIVYHFLAKDLLTDDEKRIVLRGRNAKSASIPKNISVQDYRHSTGFEALLGYLYLLDDESRLLQLLKDAVRFIERNGSNE
ncbi:MAG TPA: ribonuclease III domain-containing protein [Bacillota bacterium]|nr:ribonuclease III domain-containing protein [Bacillota bacterium]